MNIKFSIGTVASKLDLTENITLIKSSLLYADEIEMIGIMEYMLSILVPQIVNSSEDAFKTIKKLLPFIETLETKEAKEIVNNVKAILEQVEPFIYCKTKKRRNKKEILAAMKIIRRKVWL